MIFDLQKVAEQWPGTGFDVVLRNALSGIRIAELPLQQATTQGGFIDDTSVQYSLLNVQQVDDCLLIRSSVFFVEMVGGCNCYDDPAGYNVYAELEIELSLSSGQASIRLSSAG